MATSRSSVVAIVVGLSGIACSGMPFDAGPGWPHAAASAGAVAVVQSGRIEHVTPPRDFVGAHPTRLEWTAVTNIDSYAIVVENEIEIEMFSQDGITSTSVPWPKEVRLEPGTYFWRIVAIKGGRVVADSGRAAFLVRD